MKIDNTLIENLQLIIEQISKQQQDINLSEEITELRPKLEQFEIEIKSFIPAEKQPILELERVKASQKQLDRDFQYLRDNLSEIKTLILKVKASQKQLDRDFQYLKNNLLASEDNNNLQSSKNSETSFNIPQEFRKLSLFLKEEEWQEADRETALKITEMTREIKGKNPNMLLDINDFPVAKLFEIDRLWTHYSKGRFGFSMQQKLWLELGGKLYKFDSQIYGKWVKKVGWQVNNYWKKYHELNFTVNAKPGHLPGVILKWCDWGAAWCGMQTVQLFSKLD